MGNGQRELEALLEQLEADLAAVTASTAAGTSVAHSAADEPLVAVPPELLGVLPAPENLGEPVSAGEQEELRPSEESISSRAPGTSGKSEEEMVAVGSRFGEFLALDMDFGDNIDNIGGGRAKGSVKRRTSGQVLVRVLVCVLFFAVIVCILVGGLLFAASKNPSRRYFGYQLVTAMSDTMAPQKGSKSGGFRKGDILLVKVCAAEKVQIDDVVTFHTLSRNTQEAYQTHRVTLVLANPNAPGEIFFITADDASEEANLPLSGEMLVGKKVGHIPMLGKLWDTIDRHPALSLAIIAVVFTTALTCWILTRTRKDVALS